MRAAREGSRLVDGTRLVRRSSAWIVFVVAFGVGALPACTQAPSRPMAGDVTVFPYVFRTNDGQSIRAEHGRVLVPENREKADSRLIELAFVRFTSTSKTPGPPIVLVAGGPGSSGIDIPRGSTSAFLPSLVEIADVIGFDQRGTGMSRPALDCAETLGLPLDTVVTRGIFLNSVRENAKACGAFWTSVGVDLGAYTTEASADDIDALRGALGSPKITLLGGSYGSHLIFSTIRRHGANIERVVITGTEGPDHTVKLPSNEQKQLEMIGRKVAADPKIGKIVPDFVGLVRTVLGALDRQPAVVDLTDAKTGQKIKVTVSKFEVQMVTAQGLGASSFIRQLPAAYYDMSKGDYSYMAEAILERARGSVGSAMAFQMDCASGVSPERAALVKQESAATLLEDVIDLPIPDACDAAVPHDLGAAFRGPVVSDVPVLFLSGTIDGRTPPTNAEEIRKGFRNSFHIVVDNASHGAKDLLLTSAVTRDAAIAFLKGGTVTAAMAEIPALEFAMPKAPASATARRPGPGLKR